MAILVLAQAGCATTLQSIPAGYELGAGPESVAIGHVTLDLGVKPIEFFDKLAAISVFVENSSTSEKYVIVCDQTGSDSDFFVALPPGQYAVSHIDKGNMSSSLGGYFTVPQTQVAYLGTLKFVAEGIGSSMAKSVLAGQSGIYGGWVVEDDYEKSVATLSNRYPQIKQTVAKSLVVIEP